MYIKYIKIVFAKEIIIIGTPTNTDKIHKLKKKQFILLVITYVSFTIPCIKSLQTNYKLYKYNIYNMYTQKINFEYSV